MNTPIQVSMHTYVFISLLLLIGIEFLDHIVTLCLNLLRNYQTLSTVSAPFYILATFCGLCWIFPSYLTHKKERNQVFADSPKLITSVEKQRPLRIRNRPLLGVQWNGCLQTLLPMGINWLRLSKKEGNRMYPEPEKCLYSLPH
jgi:hypothetical protein